jgi:hypothetical protein
MYEGNEEKLGEIKRSFVSPLSYFSGFYGGISNENKS